MARKQVLLQESQGILSIILNRPEKKNALTGEMYQAMADALKGAAYRREIRVVVIRGNGNDFTAGNDLQDFMGWLEAKQPLDRLPVLQFIHAVLDFPKPLLVGVHGVAVGIGSTLLFHCDSVLAARSARFQLPFVRLGLVPEFGSSLLFPEFAGHVRASHWLLSGAFFDAGTAQSLGLVSEVCSDQEFSARLDALATTLSQLPPATLRQTKRLLRPPEKIQQIKQAVAKETELFVNALQSPEHQEAVRAFFEKRPPDFSRFD